MFGLLDLLISSLLFLVVLIFSWWFIVSATVCVFLGYVCSFAWGWWFAFVFLGLGFIVWLFRVLIVVCVVWMIVFDLLLPVCDLSMIVGFRLFVLDVCMF